MLKEITQTQILPDNVHKIISAGYYECITQNEPPANTCHRCLLSVWTHKASESMRQILHRRRRDVMLFLSLSDQAGGSGG